MSNAVATSGRVATDSSNNTLGQILVVALSAMPSGNPKNACGGDDERDQRTSN